MIFSCIGSDNRGDTVRDMNDVVYVNDRSDFAVWGIIQLIPCAYDSYGKRTVEIEGCIRRETNIGGSKDFSRKTRGRGQGQVNSSRLPASGPQV